jgi:hypothetical protein
MAESKFLRRYTDLPALIYLLRQKKITLLDPESWDDRIDSYFLRLYRDKKCLKTVLALCLAQSNETYHHWRVFAGGSGGVCIRFERERISKAIRKKSGVTEGKVHYRSFNRLAKHLKAEQLPFLKRAPYRPESEFRFVYQSNTRELKRDIKIPLSCIDRVTLSPWMPSDLAKKVITTIHQINGCKRLKVVQSNLIFSERWRAAGDGARLTNESLGEAVASNRAAALKQAEALRPVFMKLRDLSANAAAIKLNRRGVPTPASGKWDAKTVLRVRRRLAHH